ncbi:MAG: DUF3800 domain-containing protein [Parcubacteria group bacterium]
MGQFYAFVDESGQDTEGKFFAASVVIVSSNREQIENRLIQAELVSEKFPRKWSRSKHKVQSLFFKEVQKITSLQGTIFYKVALHKVAYTDFSATTTALAINSATSFSDQTSVYVDGLRKAELRRFRKSVRLICRRTKRIKSIRREETSVLIRLADAICGLVRQAYMGNSWAQITLATLERELFVTKMSKPPLSRRNNLS